MFTHFEIASQYINQGHIHTFVVSNSMEPLIPQLENELAKNSKGIILQPFELDMVFATNHHLHWKLTFFFPNLLHTWQPLAATAPVVLWTTSGRLDPKGEDVNQLVGPFRQASPNTIPSKQ